MSPYCTRIKRLTLAHLGYETKHELICYFKGVRQMSQEVQKEEFSKVHAEQILAFPGITVLPTVLSAGDISGRIITCITGRDVFESIKQNH